MWALFLQFIRNDLIFVVKLLIGVVLVAHRLSTRRWITARVFIVLSAAALWSILFSLWGNLDPESILYRSILKYICAFALAIASARFCYYIGHLQALFAVTVAYCLEHIAQRLQAILFHYLPAVPLWTMRTAELCLSVTLDAVFYVLLIHHFICQERDDQERNLLLACLSLIVIGTDIILSTLGIDLIMKTGASEMMVLLNIFSILISILVLVISMCDIRMKSAQKDQMIVSQLLRCQKEQFRQDYAIRDIINIKSHDLKHQIDILGAKLNREELEEIKKAVEVYDTNIDTGNTALDVVLSKKSLLCVQKGIRFTAVADGNLLRGIRDSDIYSLFGNILDNAIQSAGKMPEESHRLVTLTVEKKGGFAFIHCENYFDGDMQFKNGLPQTTNPDKHHHGFGMLSIRTLVDHYDGDLQIRVSQGVYKLDIMLPLPPENEV